MIPNHSPWIKQLRRTRPIVSLDKNIETDVVIVGGGIAGVTTAFFALRNTNQNVILIEADKIAHGATGHNAGQIASYFEKPLSEIVDEFGLDLAIDGQKSVESAWILLDQIIEEAKLRTPLHRFVGRTGLSSLDQVILNLKNNLYRKNGGLEVEVIVIAEEWEEKEKIPSEYRDLYKFLPQKDLLGLLEVKNKDYIACFSYQKGSMNSALFSEELINHMATQHKERFSFYEGSPVKVVRLKEDYGVLEILDHNIKAKRIVLCTNGFEYLKIKNEAGAEIDTKFHHGVAGRVGYMSGYLDSSSNPPMAASYFPKMKISGANDPTGEKYFYLTRRPHEHDGKRYHNLICTGGPEKVLPNGADYSKEAYCSEEVREVIDGFLKNNYLKHPGKGVRYDFCWHGLMGYTPNGIRRIGSEPCNPVLLYNLGCNGVGILPSIYGGSRISRFLNNEEVEISIFDPHDQRCEI